MEQQRVIPSGAKCLTPRQTWEKFARKKSWLWQQLRADHSFPKPLYVNGRPLFIEAELDAWLLQQSRERSQ